MSIKVGYHWHLRQVMAGAGLFATTDPVPLLAERDVILSREQVYRLVAQVPERLSPMTLAALCDILGCAPSDLVEPYRASRTPAARRDPSGHQPPRPKRARVLPQGPD
jgi:DNA-binding Xre family transcriptional regulator